MRSRSAGDRGDRGRRALLVRVWKDPDLLSSAGRRTLACLLGQKRTDTLYRILLLIWAASPAVVLAAQCRWTGVFIYLAASLAFLHLVIRQFRIQLGPNNRDAVMTGATTLVTAVGLTYSLAMVLG